MEPVEERNVCRPEGEGGFTNMEPRKVLEVLEYSNREARDAIGEGGWAQVMCVRAGEVLGFCQGPWGKVTTDHLFPSHECLLVMSYGAFRHRFNLPLHPKPSHPPEGL